MATIKWNIDDIKNMTLFEMLTHTSARDCVSVEGAVGFLVDENNIGMAIGRGGSNINSVREKLGKQVFLMGYSPDVQKFIAYLLHPAYVKNVRIQDTQKGKTAFVEISQDDYKKAVGEDHKKFEIAKLFAQRMFDISDIVIKTSIPEMPRRNKNTFSSNGNFKRTERDKGREWHSDNKRNMGILHKK